MKSTRRAFAHAALACAALAAVLHSPIRPAAAQTASPPAPFIVELVDALDTARGGPVRAVPVSAPAAAGLRSGDMLAGDAAVEQLPDGARRITIKWTSLVPAGAGAARKLAPPGETILRTQDARVPEKTRMRVAWAQGSGNLGRMADLPAGPNAEQEALNRRAREAGRLAPAGSGRIITLDQLLAPGNGNVR